MFQYLLAFLLINSCYQSWGIPTPQHQLLSFPLAGLATQCENPFLSNEIDRKSKECAEFTPRSVKKQIRCYIFYDINQQLCAAVGASQLALTEDFKDKIKAEQNIDTVCTLAKDWVFTNMSGYENYKIESENDLKSPARCGEICGVEDNMLSVNDYCKYYKWGIELLKAQVSTTNNILKKNSVDGTGTPELNSNVNSDKVPVNNNPEANTGKTKNVELQIKQTESAVPKSTPEKTENSGDVAVQKSSSQSTSQTTSSKPTANQESGPTAVKDDESDVNALEHPILSNGNTNEQVNKATLPKDSKQGGGESDPGLLSEVGKDNMSLGKDTDFDKTDSKDDADYPGNEDDEPEEPEPNINLPKNQEPILDNKPIISHNSDISQKEFYPNTMPDGFPDDGDHFFPFFLTAVILVVLLYVLYHNKNKVSKVFFGLILEGRQVGRRRNSRGHAYRRLDTLEQAMSANTAAPPSKIIY